MQDRKPYPSDVGDDEWAFVAPYLTLMTEEAPQWEHPLREVFHGLRWIVRAGAPWRMLPNDLPPWEAVYQQTQRWQSAGVFEAMVNDLRVLLRVVLQKFLKTARNTSTLCLFSLSGHSKEAGNKGCLPHTISFFGSAHLPFPQHIHDLITLQRLPRCLKGKEAQPRFDQPFDEAVILLDQAVEIFDLTEFTLGWKRALLLQLAQRFGIGRVFVDRDHVGS